MNESADDHLNSDGLFAKIVRGEIPCHRVYEDEHVLAFLDIGPIARGHVLVIPKKAYRTLDTMDDDTAAAVGRVLPRIARAVMTATGVGDFNLLQNNGEAAGQAVEHVHFHIIPRPPHIRDNAQMKKAATGGDGLQFNWHAGELGSDDAIALRDAIVSVLSSNDRP